MWRLVICLLLLPVGGLAGPWLREEGAGFLSYSATLENVERTGAATGYASVYAEYGVRPRLTLGMDLGADERGFSKAFGFAVLPLGPQDSAMKYTLELGLGMIEDEAIFRPGLAIGRGYTLGRRHGWVSVESRAEIGIEDGGTAFSTDVTLGLNASARAKWMVQIQHGGPMADPDYLRVVPSVALQTKPGRHIELGVTAGIKNAAAVGIKLGVWREF